MVRIRLPYEESDIEMPVSVLILEKLTFYSVMQTIDKQNKGLDLMKSK